MIIATYSDGKLREFTIEEADRMGVQAEAMAAGIESATERFENAIGALATIAEEAMKTLQAARDALVDAKGKISDLRKERDVCFQIRDSLERQIKDGVPFLEATLVIERDEKKPN